MTRLHVSIVLALGCFYLGGCVAANNRQNTGIVEQPDVKQTPPSGADAIEVYEEKWPEGGLKLQVEGWEDDEGNFIRHGRTTMYWENGRKKSEVHYVDGAPHGPRTAWYNSGQIWSSGEYVDGKEDGTWTVWFPDGRKAQELRFDHGKYHGLHTEWHPNGQKRTEVEYVDGKQQGTLTFWDEQGKIVRRVEFVNGVEQP